MEHNDRICVVTGASRGIGRGIAERLAQTGASVIVNYHSSEAEAHDVVATIENEGGTAIPIQADVTDREQVEAMREQVHERFGPADVLINNAGITFDTSFATMTDEEWHQVIGVNLHGVFYATKTFYEDIKTADDGRLINISSIVGKQGNFGQANYAAAKSGVFGFTRTLALELAPAGSTANCVAPGFTETDMLTNVPAEVREHLQNEIPLERFATTEDIAELVHYLASPKSSYITGEIIDVNGGMDL